MAPSAFTTLTNGSLNARGEFAQHLQRHYQYYINGGDIHFLVENYVFRVHRYFFERESAYFRDKLSFPPTPGRAPQGTEDANAIVLDVRAQDFEKLMWVFYNPKYSIYEADVPTWAVILQLSHRWWFPEVKALCVRELEQKEMTPIDRIVLYQKYEVDENLLLSRFAAVCAREEPISVEEGEMLGIKTAMRLTQARERLRSADGSKSPLPPHRNDKDVHDIVVSLFEIIEPESLRTPATATTTTTTTTNAIPAQQQPEQPASTISATTAAPTTPAPATKDSTAAPTPATSAAATTPSLNTTTPATGETQPAKGPTPKSSLVSLKANTKADQKATPTPDTKSTSEPPKAKEASAKDAPGSTNASTADLTSSPLIPNTTPNAGTHAKAPSMGSALSGLGLWGGKGSKESENVDAPTAEGTTNDEVESATTPRGKKSKKAKGGLF